MSFVCKVLYIFHRKIEFPFSFHPISMYKTIVKVSMKYYDPINFVAIFGDAEKLAAEEPVPRLKH